MSVVGRLNVVFHFDRVLAIIAVLFPKMDGAMSPQNIDNVILPAEINFKYTSVHVAGPGLSRQPNEIMYEGCDCAVASCSPRCPCISRHGPNYDDTGHAKRFLKGPGTAAQSRPVYECNASCQCGPECVNRAVQNGPPFPLEVFTTRRKGYGVRCPVPIPEDAFVCEYAGEVLTLGEARDRMRRMRPRDANYIMVVRESLANGTVITTSIDPTHIGNVGRYVNHSCQPNLYLVTVRVDNEVPRVAMFAKSKIDAGQELAYSYWGDHAPQRAAGGHDEVTRQRSECFCESDTCLGLLPCNDALFDMGT